MIPGPTFRSGKSPPDFPEWSPLGSLGFGLGPSPDDLSRCFSRNAGVTVVLSCAPTLLHTDVSCSHFITFPLCPVGRRPKEQSEWWNLPPRVPALWPYCVWIQTYKEWQPVGNDETILWLCGSGWKRNGKAQVCRLLCCPVVFLNPDRDVEVVLKCLNLEIVPGSGGAATALFYWTFN